MTKEKNIDAGKKDNQPQDKLTDERLTDEQLDKVAGGGDTMRTREDWKRLLPFLTDKQLDNVAGGRGHAIEDFPKLIGSPSGK